MVRTFCDEAFVIETSAVFTLCISSCALFLCRFLIHEEFQGIFDYVARLHNLIPSRLSATLTNQVTEVSSLEHVEPGPRLDATLNIVGWPFSLMHDLYASNEYSSI